MLSMTDADTTISLATPDDVRQASEKAVNIWVGALSPLWAPFLAATAAGLSFWSMSQAMKRFGFAGVEGPGDDTHLFTRWPGFVLPFASPWSQGWGDAAEDADRIVELTHEALSAPIQIAFEAEEKLEDAIEEAITTAHESLDLLTPKADDLFPVAETVNAVPAQAVVETAEKSSDAATEVAKTTVKAAKPVADTAADLTEKAAKTAEAAAKSAKAVIDPVSETPVVPAVAEATAEKLPLPLAEVSPAAAPRKPRKPKA